MRTSDECRNALVKDGIMYLGLLAVTVVGGYFLGKEIGEDAYDYSRAKRLEHTLKESETHSQEEA